MSPLHSFDTVDFVVLAVALAGLVAMAALARRGVQTSDGLLFADRSLGWWWLTPTLTLTGLTVLVYAIAPREAYYFGLRPLLVPICLWAALPILFRFVLPLYANLELDSVYEYLELRFDPAMRVGLSAWSLAGQLVWLGGIVALPGYAIGLGGHLSWPGAVLVLAIAVVATASLALGGMQGTAYGAVVQLVLAFVAVGTVLLVASALLPNGMVRVWQIADILGRGTIVDTRLPWAPWSALAAVPALAILWTYLTVADQPTVQRLLSAGRPLDMNFAFLSSGALTCLLLPLAVCAGVTLLAVYQHDPQAEMPPQWIIRSAVDPDTGRPVIGPDTVVDEDTIGGLVAAGAILDPNTRRPLRSTEGLVDAEGRIVIDRLAVRAPPRQGGERYLQTGQDRLLVQFVGQHVRRGWRGVVLAGLAAAAIAVVAAGLLAAATLALIDFHRRHGWAETWLARRCGKPAADLDQADELRLARPLALACGAAVTLIGLGLTTIADLPRLLWIVLGLLAGPGLAVFLLGLLTRRATAAAARLGLVVGTVVGVWAACGHHLATPGVARWFWPFTHPLGIFWPVTFGFAATLLLGYLASFVIGRKKSHRELVGLVAGLGPLGVLADVDRLPSDLAHLVDQNATPRQPWR